LDDAAGGLFDWTIECRAGAKTILSAYHERKWLLAFWQGRVVRALIALFSFWLEGGLRIYEFRLQQFSVRLHFDRISTTELRLRIHNWSLF
jgi:hypothetical protein